MSEINKLAAEIHNLAIEKGWYDTKQTEDEYIERMSNNLHDEVSELHTAWRENNIRSLCDKSDKMKELGLRPLTCLEEELADIIIRSMDNAVYLGLDIEECINIKHSYNKSRPHRHGNKRS